MAESGSPKEAEPAMLRGSTSVGLVPAAATNAFENIALAHREIYALHEIAQSMGTSLGVSDTMALISSKLSKIVPWSGCALFLHQPIKTVLINRKATLTSHQLGQIDWTLCLLLTAITGIGAVMLYSIAGGAWSPSLSRTNEPVP